MKYKIVGLMLTRDNLTILNDWLDIHNKYFDKIFCLDGSINFKKESKDILLKYNVEYSHDDNYPRLCKTDHGLRKVIYDKIKKYINDKKDYDYWIVLIHPDEFYQFNINNIIDIAYSKKAHLIRFNSCHNAPQKNEIEQWKKKKTYKVFKHFLYPGHIENRIFKYSDKLYYNNKTHSLVIPHGLNTKNCFIGGKILHYKIQNPDLILQNGKITNSCWSSLLNYYPIGRKFNKPEDFILDIPVRKYKNNKIFKGVKKKINLLYWNAGSQYKYNNFGDELSKLITNFLINKNKYKLTYNNKNSINNLLCVGSYLQNAENNYYIYGTGLRQNNLNIALRYKKLKIYAVRGPLTKEFLEKKGYSVPNVFGDPALLLALFYKPLLITNLINKIGIIPHISNYNKYLKKIIDYNKYYLINPTDKWDNVINQIYSCKYIISSSLHGLICSDTYNKPNLWLDEYKLQEGHFKFKDYFLSQNRKLISINNINNFDKKLLYTGGNNIDLKLLMKSFPFK